MRAIILLFDSLNKRYLPPYGDALTKAPNLQRLAAHAATFENSYVGSMPCMPAASTYRAMHSSSKWSFQNRLTTPCRSCLKRQGIYPPD